MTPRPGHITPRLILLQIVLCRLCSQPASIKAVTHQLYNSTILLYNAQAVVHQLGRALRRQTAEAAEVPTIPHYTLVEETDCRSGRGAYHTTLYYSGGDRLQKQPGRRSTIV